MYEFSVLWSGKYFQYWENELHSHSYYQIIAVLKSGGRITLGEETIPMQDRQVLLIRPHTIHSIIREEQEPQPQLMDIKFTVADEQLARDLNRLPAVLDVDFGRFQYYFDHILRESAQAAPYSYNCVCYYFGLTLVLLLRSQRPQTGLPRPDQLQELPTGRTTGVDMTAVIRYIQENYITPITLEDLAKVASVSKSTLILAFKQTLNTTPNKYINQVRLGKAKELLLTTNSNISEISEMVGFQSLHYFSRYFKNHEQVSPVEYRQRYSSSRFYTYRQPIGLPEPVLHSEKK